MCCSLGCDGTLQEDARKDSRGLPSGDPRYTLYTQSLGRKPASSNGHLYVRRIVISRIRNVMDRALIRRLEDKDRNLDWGVLTFARRILIGPFQSYCP